MAPLKLVVAAAALSVAAGQAQCLEKYQCIFHHNVGAQEYSWDLHQLCRGPGNEYTSLDAQNHTYSFNICGNTSTLCAPGWPLYDSHGVAVQTWSSPPPCASPPACTDADTGNPVCCTGNCAVLAQPFFQFQLMDNNNPMTGGVQLYHVGMPPDKLDSFPCPTTSAGLFMERQLTIQIACDTGGSTSRLDITAPAREVSPCMYAIYAKSKAGCGVKGDPFDGYRDDPAHSFGFVVLGSFLTILVYGIYVLGDGRGWWEPIKARLPSWCCRGGGGSVSFSSGSSSYKGIGTAATPITASAYGT